SRKRIKSPIALVDKNRELIGESHWNNQIRLALAGKSSRRNPAVSPAGGERGEFVVGAIGQQSLAITQQHRDLTDDNSKRTAAVRRHHVSLAIAVEIGRAQCRRTEVRAKKYRRLQRSRATAGEHGNRAGDGAIADCNVKFTCAIEVA